MAALLLEIERVQANAPRGVVRRSERAAPLIGSSAAIREIRDRIQRVAPTDFTVLIEGRSRAAPRFFIEVFGEAAVRRGQREWRERGRMRLR